MTLYQGVLKKQLDANWNSIATDTQSWNLLRDQGFLLLQSLVNNHLQDIIKMHLRLPGDDFSAVQDSSTVDALNRTLERMKQVEQKMQKSYLNLIGLTKAAKDRMGQDIQRFCYRDCALDDWSKIFKLRISFKSL